MNGLDRTRSVAQALRDYYSGVGEVGLALGTGMAAQVPAGISGGAEYLSSLLRNRSTKLAGGDAAARVQQVQDALTYEPRGDVSRRGVENIGKTMQAVTEPLKETLVDPVGDRVPILGAAMLAGAELVGPKAKPKPKRGLVNLKLREMPEQDAIATALREEHLVPIKKDEKGSGYVGGPRNVKSRRQLAANRRRMDRELGAAAHELEAAGEVPGDWYPSQKRGIEAIAEPWQQKRTAEETALMSSQTDPEGERGFMLQAHNRMARGEPVGVAHTGRQGREFEASAREGRPMKLGQKTGMYQVLSDPTVEPSIFGTNDFRQAQFHGYTEPTGKPQRSGLNPPQHAFLDAETLLLTQRANRKALGGRADWTGPMAQEVPWIVEKADSLQKRFPKRFPKTEDGRVAALREASKTGEDYNLKHAVGATYERIPGASTGHDPQIVSAPFEQRLGYSQDAPWTRGGRDVIYQGQGLLQLPTTQGVGIWEGATNPNFIAKPLGDIVATKGKGAKGRELAPGMVRQLELGENLRGLVDVQEAVAANLPMRQVARKAGTKTHGLLQHDAPLNEQQMRDLAAKLPPEWTPTPTPSGTLLIGPHPTSRAASQDFRQIDAAIGSPVERVGMEGTYFPVYQGTTPGQGQATSAFLRRAAESPEASVQGMSESDAVRGAIRDIHRRDALRESEGATIRPDVQATRRFLSDADWAKAVKLIRQGMTPAAALAAMGYSLSGMAAEEAPR